MNLTIEHRRALQLLSGRPEGVHESMLVSQGISISTTADLIRAELATELRETSPRSGRRVRITWAGENALVEW